MTFLALPDSVIPPCVDTELVQFPLRMRDWLKNVLLQLYEHDSMSPGFLTPKQRFRVRRTAHMGNEWKHVVNHGELGPLVKLFSPTHHVVEWFSWLWTKRMLSFSQAIKICGALLWRWRKSLKVRDVCTLAITPLSCWHRTLRRTTTCTSTRCTGSLLSWTNTPLTGAFYSSPQPSCDTQRLLHVSPSFLFNLSRVRRRSGINTDGLSATNQSMY